VEKLKTEKLLQIMFPVSSDGIPLPRTSRYGDALFTLSALKKLIRCCHVDMTAKVGCLSRVGGSGSERDISTTRNIYISVKESHPRIAVMLTWLHRRHILLLIM
jgi:hypothetical protein